jgi:hypothetical protein
LSHGRLRPYGCGSIPIGPTARLRGGKSLDDLAAMTPEQIRKAGLFPYPALPHPAQGGGLGGQVFPKMQIDMFPRLQRYDVDFDIPDVFLPEFPPAMYLQNRPELGDVSRGEVVSINNYYRPFKDVLTPVQLDGLRLLLTPFPQEEFNPTDDRKSANPVLGVTCLDCHVNGHTTGQFHINPDDRREQRRMRLDTVSLRGLFNQHIDGSKRSLRSVEDFTEFEQRTAYFNGDAIHAMKKGMNILDRIQVSHMAQMQSDAGGAARRADLLRQGAMRELPSAAVLPRPSDARSVYGAFSRRSAARADQDVHVARAQGQPAVSARRALPDDRGHRRVLQPRTGTPADGAGESGPGRVPAPTLGPYSSASWSWPCATCR